jgi:hypothetical protein
MIDKNSNDLLMSDLSLVAPWAKWEANLWSMCEAPASLLISQETGRIIRTDAKRRRSAAVQSQAKAPDGEMIKTRDKFLTKSFLPTS